MFDFKYDSKKDKYDGSKLPGLLGSAWLSYSLEPDFTIKYFNDSQMDTRYSKDLRTIPNNELDAYVKNFVDYRSAGVEKFIHRVLVYVRVNSEITPSIVPKTGASKLGDSERYELLLSYVKDLIPTNGFDRLPGESSEEKVINFVLTVTHDERL